MGWGGVGRDGARPDGVEGAVFFLREEKPQTLDKAFAPKRLRSVHVQGAIANGLTWYLNCMV